MPAIHRDQRGRYLFSSSCAAAMGLVLLAVCAVAEAPAEEIAGDLPSTLFPADLPELDWAEFRAEGYPDPVSGILYSAANAPTSGVPLGGLSTGCLDIEAGGVFGFSSLFIPIPHRPQLLTPFLGVSVGGETWVMADEKYIAGGDLQGNCDPREEVDPKEWVAHLTPLDSVKPATAIHYWGHYPLVDLEYESSCPVRVGLRAWSPFIPGDTPASDIPAAVFEVHLRNPSSGMLRGTLAFSFPGPTHAGTHPRWAILDPQQGLKPVVWPNSGGLGGWCSPGWPELTGGEFIRKTLTGNLTGLSVKTLQGDGYVLGVVGEAAVRSGGSLSEQGRAWSRISSTLPQPRTTEHAEQGTGRAPEAEGGASLPSASATFTHAGASVALDFELQARQERVVRIILAWYSPTWKGTPETRYRRAYAARYQDAEAVARSMADSHDSLLKRILSWQQEIYAGKSLPGWLQDGLINSLYLITETSLWALPEPPLDSWCSPAGLFGMIESPRGCPQMECLPCTWYGTLPVLFFFPDLAELNLQGHLHYQREDGAAAFNWGWGADMSKPLDYAWQVMLNGFCFVDLNYRFWERSNYRPDVLRRCYQAVKKSVSFSMSLRSGPDSVISMPEGNKGEEWWEHSGWFGMTAHAGGLRLSQLRMAHHMAQAAGDDEFAQKCTSWLQEGSDSMETHMWNEATQSYLTAFDRVTGQKNEDIMANQFDAEWVNNLHALPTVFDCSRTSIALNTVMKTCLSQDIGAVSFADPDGSPQRASYGIFVPEIYMLGMTYLHRGTSGTGLGILRNCLRNQFLRQRIGWDQTNMLSDTDGGIRTAGSDYYQNTVLWAAPAAIERKPLTALYEQGGLVQRILDAGKPR